MLRSFIEKANFDAKIDDLTLMTHITKGKAEPSTYRIKRLLKVLCSLLYNQYYMKGKEMMLTDFLSTKT